MKFREITTEIITELYSKFILVDGEIYKKNGKIAGIVDKDGYRQIRLAGKYWRVHRLLMFIKTGKQPNVVDHYDRIKDNNIESNLRDTDHSTNSQNSERFKNFIFKEGNSYRVSFTVNGKTVHISSEKSLVEAEKLVNLLMISSPAEILDIKKSRTKYKRSKVPGVAQSGAKFQLHRFGVYLGTFSSREEAEEVSLKISCKEDALLWKSNK